jgi:queuine tRNA-ribosyltransferase
VSPFELIRVRCGAWSLRSTENGEVFHPGIGPMEEARILHVAQQRIAERLTDGFVFWDVGLGAAANAIAAIEAISKAPGSGVVHLHSFDLSSNALEFALKHSEVLEYLDVYSEAVHELLQAGNSAIESNWRIEWQLHPGDFTERVREGNLPEAPDAIFYDPYSPKRNGAMWTLEHFERLRRNLTKSCIATSYTRSTAIRVTFLCAGFYVGRGVGIGEKNETSIFATTSRLLEKPLTRDWLERVRRSRNSAPWTETSDGSQEETISAEQLAQLECHPQFKAQAHGS